jgi:hypothetical protein
VSVDSGVHACIQAFGGPPLPQSWCAHGALSGGLESWHAAPASIASLSAGQHARTPPRPAESRFPRSRPQQAPFTLLGLKGELSPFGGTATSTSESGSRLLAGLTGQCPAAVKIGFAH